MALKITGTNVIDDSLVAIFDTTYVKTMTVQERSPPAVGTVSGYTSSGSTQPSAPGVSNTIDQFPFSTPFATATDVGDSSTTKFWVGSTSSSTYGYILGGAPSPSGSIIDQFPFSAPFGTATNIGSLSEGSYGSSGASSNTDGYRMGGYRSSPTPVARSSKIDQFPFSTPFTTATNIGNLTLALFTPSGQSSTTHGYSSGGGSPSVNTINKFPFSTPFTTATDVGDLSQARQRLAGNSSETYGYASGGLVPTTTNTIDRFPFSTPFTTATDVGDMSRIAYHLSSQSSETNGYITGGFIPSTASSTNTIERFPFNTPFTTATDIADLSRVTQAAGGHQD